MDRIFTFIRNQMLALRVSRFFTALLGQACRVSTDMVEIDITVSCNINCFKCDRSCRTAPSTDKMSVSQIEEFIRESVEQKRKWSQFRVLGGEPTLHPDFTTIISLLRSYKEKHSPETIIEVVTNGYGPQVTEILKALPEDIRIDNTNKTTPEQKNFCTVTFVPTAHPSYMFADYTNGCYAMETCGMGFNKYGFYPCGPGAALDRVYGFDIARKHLPPPDDAMFDMLKKLCPHCGYFIREGGNIFPQRGMSPEWKEAYRKYKEKKPILKEY